MKTLNIERIRRFILCVGVIACAALAGPAPAAPPFSAMVVFGDSLSDTGNVSQLTAGLVPPSPYVNGRFSNGPVTVEYLASALGLQVLPYYASGGSNYAVGGATSGVGNVFDNGSPTDTGYLRLPGLAPQLAAYTSNHAAADPNALYFVLAGSTDFVGTVTDPDAAVNTAINNVSNAIQTLRGLGAQHMVVPNLPDFGLIPRKSGDPATAAAATALSVDFNQRLANLIAAVNAGAGPDIMPFDTFGVLHLIVDDPQAYGFTDVTHACYDGNNVCAPTLDAQNRFLFWDDVHPTTAGAAVFANRLISAVPEPAMAALLAFGLCLLAGVRAAAIRRAAGAG